MLRERGQYPDRGMLGGEAWLGRTTIRVSYWRSVEHLFGYAKRRDAEHLARLQQADRHERRSWGLA